mgnify:CR=1 FL=1
MLTYKKSGVDIDKADALVDFIKERAPAIGGFSGLFPLKLQTGAEPFLVATTDGVGTKLKIAFALNQHETIGLDLVAMCANDLITCGAKPLFFLDYYATGKLDLTRSKNILKGILNGCRQASMSLLGGETAEMPGFYPHHEYDLAGFAVGLVDKKELIDGSNISPRDIVIGLPSTGLHSNGFSLVRKIFKTPALLKNRGQELLTPTKIYVRDIENVLNVFRKENHQVLGMAHITGGGLIENLPRILPSNCKAILYKHLWEVPPLFRELQKRGRVPESEMWRTFNMGLGMTLVLKPKSLPLIKRVLPEARQVGEIVSGSRQPQITIAA